MKLYNDNEVKNYKTIQTDNGIFYTDKLSTEQLNSYGYYVVREEREDPLQFHTLEKSGALVNDEWVISYTNVPVTLDEAKVILKQQIKSKFIEDSTRPKVDTGLGYFVDGGREDLENFKVGKEFGLSFVKDVDGVNHDVTDADYDTIILAIKTHGLIAYQDKWSQEALVDNLTTIEECISFTE